MRGDNVRTESLFSSLSREAKVAADHPLRPIRTIVDQALIGLVAGLRVAILHDWPAVDSAREAAAGPLAAGPVLGALGAPAYGPTRLQPAVPLVRRLGEDAPGPSQSGQTLARRGPASDAQVLFHISERGHEPRNQLISANLLDNPNELKLDVIAIKRLQVTRTICSPRAKRRPGSRMPRRSPCAGHGGSWLERAETSVRNPHERCWRRALAGQF